MNTSTAAVQLPDIDASQQDCLTDEQAQFFRDYGLLVIRNVIRGDELRRLQDETGALIAQAAASRVEDNDFQYAQHETTGREVPCRIEYVIEKTASCKALLGHPFILRTVEKLQGRDFIPTWDSMVFKFEGAGKAVPWHRDAGNGCVGDKPIFNVDFYLDPADLSTCLWGILGSNQWSDEQSKATCQRLNENGFQKTEDTIPILMQPGDVILHNILALHGSPPSQTTMRRTVYLEFRPAETERALGPHTPEYIPLKQKVLLACLRDRARAPYSKGETPFVYNPTDEFNAPALGANEELTTYRLPHNEYWRK